MQRAALLLIALAILADAWVTRRKLSRGGVHEGNHVRLFLIRTLGLNGGTLGVGAALAVGFAAFAWNWPLSPTVIVSELFIALAFGWVAWSNTHRGGKV